MNPTNLEQLRKLHAQLGTLLADPQPGIWTWNIALSHVCRQLGEFNAPKNPPFPRFFRCKGGFETDALLIRADGADDICAVITANGTVRAPHAHITFVDCLVGCLRGDLYEATPGEAATIIREARG